MNLICGIIAFLYGIALLVNLSTSLSDGQIAGIGLVAAGAGLLVGPVVGLVRR